MLIMFPTNSQYFFTLAMINCIQIKDIVIIPTLNNCAWSNLTQMSICFRGVPLKNFFKQN